MVKENIDILKVSMDSADLRGRVMLAGSRLAADTPRILEDCCASGIRTIGINFVFMKDNADQLEKIVEFSASMKRKYGTDMYVSILDFYYSPGNRLLWLDQFIDLRLLRDRLRKDGHELRQRIRVGCDSYHYRSCGVLIHMKDSISGTYRIDRCAECSRYCQEGVYSLKHSASGWISVCPVNDPSYGALLLEVLPESEAHKILDHYIVLLNTSVRCENSGKEFFRRNQLEVPYV